MEVNIKETNAKGYRLSLKLNGKEIGRCYVYLIWNDLHEKPYALLEDVWINEGYRGKGYGTELVKRVIDFARSNGCYKIIATSRFERENVHRFYERIGFNKWGYEFRIDL